MQKLLLKCVCSLCAYVFSIVLIEVGDVLDDLLVAEVLERLFPCETKYLPKDDGE